jgi:hypothetical protein
MRWAVQAAVVAVWLAAGAFGQEVRKPADWEKMYQDASAQLQAAQNRKAELAADNTRLAAKAAQLQRDLQTAQAQADSLGQEVAAFQGETWMLHAFYQGWEAFIAANPPVLASWQRFWGGPPAWSDNMPVIVDPNWPLTGR